MAGSAARSGSCSVHPDGRHPVPEILLPGPGLPGAGGSEGRQGARLQALYGGGGGGHNCPLIYVHRFFVPHPKGVV